MTGLQAVMTINMRNYSIKACIYDLQVLHIDTWPVVCLFGRRAYLFCSLTHSLTHSPTQLLTHSITHSITQSLSHLFDDDCCMQWDISPNPLSKVGRLRPIRMHLLHEHVTQSHMSPICSVFLLLHVHAVTADVTTRDQVCMRQT